MSDPRAGNALHDPTRFGAVVALTATATAIGLVVTVPAWLAAGVALTVIVVLGIPHGALDYTVALHRGADRRRFALGYSAAVMMMGLVWLAAPPVALAAFLVMSVHHFGQSDLAYLRLAGARQSIIQGSRGILLVGVPLIAHLELVSPAVVQLGAPDPEEWGWLAGHQMAWCIALITQHVVVLLVCSRRMADSVVYEATSLAALCALFIVADPLIGFAVYFGLWHAHSHLLVIAEQLGIATNPLRSTLRRAAPVSAIAVIAMALASGVVVIRSRPDLIVPTAFVALSMLTVPHLAVVERLWRSASRLPSRRRLAVSATR
ncbi:MAG: Brp/Blh family beta-carotene 15,15'-dioxygenase [Actinomycetota bacterium]